MAREPSSQCQHTSDSVRRPRPQRLNSTSVASTLPGRSNFRPKLLHMRIASSSTGWIPSSSRGRVLADGQRMLDNVASSHRNTQSSNHGLVHGKARRRIADITQSGSQARVEKERIYPSTSTLLSLSKTRGRRGGTSSSCRSPRCIMPPTQLKLSQGVGVINREVKVPSKHNWNVAPRNTLFGDRRKRLLSTVTDVRALRATGVTVEHNSMQWIGASHGTDRMQQAPSSLELTKERVREGSKLERHGSHNSNTRLVWCVDGLTGRTTPKDTV